VVAICGLGGMGKTQLSIHFARRFVETYSSIFWLNAQNENTLERGLVELAAQVLEERKSASMNDSHEEDLTMMDGWLCMTTTTTLLS
jgi:CO dehydrogenase nickel-insertion accessory protein CooC1